MPDTKDQTGYQHLIEDWKKKLEAGDNTWLDELYSSNLDKFIVWASRKYELDDESVKDVFQQAVISMYENIRYNRIKNLASSPSTYLFGIGKNLILKQLRENKKVDTHQIRLQEHWTFVQLDEETLDQTFTAVKDVLGKMKEPCRSIISLFYIRAMSIKSIAEKLDYKSPDVVKTQKSRCMKALKQAVEERIR